MIGKILAKLLKGEDAAIIEKKLEYIESKVFKPDAVVVSKDGWNQSDYAWVYVSPTSFKIVGMNVTEMFPIGTKLRLKQGGEYKYYYASSAIMSGNDTLVTIVG